MMKLKQITSILFGLLFLIAINAEELIAQNIQQKDSVISSAMRDELNRNMEKLNEEGYQKPFFVGYRVSDINLRISNSTFGSLILSREARSRDWNTRIMVGDYRINDENFSDSFEGTSNDSYLENIPVEDDYWGIRRVLWASTNNVYKRAARLYKQKLKAIEEFEIDYQLNDFSKETPVKYIDDKQYNLASQGQLDEMSKNLSGYLKKYDSIYNGSATITDIGMRSYYENSEGTSLIKDEQITIALISASRVDNELRYQSATVDYFAKNFTELPSEDEMKKDLDWYMDYLKRKTSMKELEDDYNGPVLLSGQAVAEFFKANLFKSNQGIFPMRQAFSNKNEQAVSRFFEELEKDMTEDDKLKIGNKKMIVTSHPFMKTFQGIKLAGAYMIDSEGVLPKDSLVLIRDGMVQQKLNGRLPAPKAENSTGSKRFSVAIGGMGDMIAPGVIVVDFSNKVSEATLWDNFKQQISANDEEVGVVIEMPDLKSSSKPRQYYVYNRINESKEQITKATFSYTAKNILKKIVAVSEEYFVYNFLFSGNNYGSTSSGVPVSIIVPKMIFLEDVDISKSSYKARKMDAIVPKPDLIQR